MCNFQLANALPVLSLLFSRMVKTFYAQYGTLLWFDADHFLGNIRKTLEVVTGFIFCHIE